MAPPPPRSTLSSASSLSINFTHLLSTLLPPLLPLLETTHRLLINILALALLLSTLPFSLYLRWGQTPRIARGEGLVGVWVKEWSGYLWEGFDWLEECESEGCLREWMGRTLGIQGLRDGHKDDGSTHSTSASNSASATGTFKRGRRRENLTPTTTSTAYSSSSSPAAAARRDSGIELVD